MSVCHSTTKPNRMNSSVLKDQGSNQTLNQETIKDTTLFRKIRIIVSDPDATDSSDDDHRRPAKNSSPKRRKIVHEIFLPYDDAGEEASMECAGEMSETNLKRFRGVRRRKSGRWTAEIRDPFRKRRVFLGSFGTGEEASRAYEAKKVAFRERLEAQSAKDRARSESGSENISSSQSFLLNDDGGEKSSSGGVTRTDLKRFRGIRRRKSGSWSAEIRDPFKKRKVFWGMFGTAGEASRVSRVFEAKKVALRERREPRSALNRARSGSDSSDQSVLLNDNAGEKLSVKVSGETTGTDLERFRGVRVRKSGKWTAEIRDPIMKRKVFLGSFGTGEEASRAFEAKKVEFLKRQEAQSAMDRARPGTDDSLNQSVEQNEAGMNLGSILIDNNGFLLGEFSNLDDDLKILD